jgi:hypothetical protein
VLVVLQKVAAGRPAFACRNHVLVRSIAIHDENLIALQLIARRLKNDALAVRRPIRLGVFASIRQLADLTQMPRRLRQDATNHENV